ncbi:helix-turn-helix transcriptional regulator [Paucibacter soli]|uniref:helix-turn-helix transcriptional regulator n=1 Tax=Paucibacter soli TaxID=3133433 RepID=UPI0030AFB180
MQALLQSQGVEEQRPSWAGLGLPDYRGPERRRRAPALGLPGALFSRALDEIDLGLLLVSESGQLHYANHMARSRLAQHAWLCLHDDCLSASQEADQLRLRAALQAAALQGLRRLITLGQGAARLMLSVIPMALGDNRPGALVLLGKQQLCGELSIHAFAREHRLTSAEQQVLQALCEGLQPQDIAARHQVAVSTIRTQIASLRAKTQAESIRDLVGLVAMLPPMLSVLRG